MIAYLMRRCLYMVLSLWVMSVVAFVIIELPPGDWIGTYITQLQAQGTPVDEAEAAGLRRQYGFDLPIYLRYFKWIWKMLQGDFGKSFDWNRPVGSLIGERLMLSIIISLSTLFFTYLVAIPIGIYSATHQYSISDYIFTVFGFVGLAIPNFFLALVLAFIFSQYFGISMGGLFSPQYIGVPWSLARVADMITHLWAPIVVVGTGSVAWLMRVMRSSLLDELSKQYVITARAKGLSEMKLIFKYPIRVAINPVVSAIGWTLPSLVSGETITSMVLVLPTIGPLLFQALRSQDMYLAGTIVLFLSFLTIIGTFISDILLVWVDPRIQYQ